jgi:C-terminal processing protease CtpA/Prc
VAKGSPADGILKTGDVILGVGDQPFDGDALIEFAHAITAAETEQGGGVLRLIRWRIGQTQKRRVASWRDSGL